MPETYLTRNQIAKRLGVHAATVDRMAADGRLPTPMKLSLAVNGRIRFRPLPSKLQSSRSRGRHERRSGL
jgi:hypothetical protein